MHTTGMDLKVERVRARVTVIALAARMGFSRQTVGDLERAAVVDKDRARAYREALAALTEATA
jgi:hypothetical protein